VSGFSGFSGTSGFSGHSGFSGVSGFSGFSGLSGVSGVLLPGTGTAIPYWGGSSWIVDNTVNTSTYAPASGSANYIQNQYSAAQTSSEAWLSGRLRAGNILLDANTISSQNTNGDIILDPNGSGNTSISNGEFYIRSSRTESVGYQLNAITSGYNIAGAYGWITAGGAASRTALVLNGGGGNVGIGTTAPDEKLHVTGNMQLGTNSNQYIKFRTASAWDYSLSAVNDDISFIDNQSTIFWKAFYNGGGAGKYISLLGALNVINNNRVGIVTTAPTATLEVGVNEAISHGIKITTGVWHEPTINFNPHSNFGFTLGNFGLSGSKKFQLRANDENVIFSTGGNNSPSVGFNQVSPQVALEVNGNVHFGGAGATNGFLHTISLGYREDNLLYRKAAFIQEQLGDAAARGNLHIAVNTAATSASAVVADSKIKIDGITGVMTFYPTIVHNALAGAGTETSALLLNGSNEIVRRTLGTGAFATIPSLQSVMDIGRVTDRVYEMSGTNYDVPTVGNSGGVRFIDKTALISWGLAKLDDRGGVFHSVDPHYGMRVYDETSMATTASELYHFRRENAATRLDFYTLNAMSFVSGGDMYLSSAIEKNTYIGSEIQEGHLTDNIYLKAAVKILSEAPHGFNEQRYIISPTGVNVDAGGAITVASSADVWLYTANVSTSAELDSGLYNNQELILTVINSSGSGNLTLSSTANSESYGVTVAAGKTGKFILVYDLTLDKWFLLGSSIN